jgi:uncharacterized membrane protein YgdD (TMEM256/DUF423 family)
MVRLWFVLGCVSCGLGVAAGAFAAHALRQKLPSDLLTVFETGARYQIYHGLGLFSVAFAAARWPSGHSDWAGWAFLAGILLFSGSLYLLSLSGIRAFGAITPLGGLCFLAGWALLAWGVGAAGSN